MTQDPHVQVHDRILLDQKPSAAATHELFCLADGVLGVWTQEKNVHKVN